MIFGNPSRSRYGYDPYERKYLYYYTNSIPNTSIPSTRVYDQGHPLTGIDSIILSDSSYLSSRNKSYLDTKVESPTAALADPLDRFLSGKRDFLIRSVKDIGCLIYEREMLRKKNFYKIDYGICYVGYKVGQLGPWYSGMNQNIDRQRSSLDKEVFGLEKEKRMEDVSCWRDIWRLKLELRDVLKELDQEERKRSFVLEGLDYGNERTL